MRLIDADALIETMKRVEEEYEDAMTMPSWWTAYSVISEQPTAYDVEKVVKGIEEFYEEAEDYGFVSALSDIVEVVKWGGINE